MTATVKSLTEAAAYMAKRGLVWGNSGNISALDGDTNNLWISASGTVISEIREDEFVQCPIDGKPLSERMKPSKELPMHQAIYTERPEIRCVLHASPFYSTLVACSSIRLDSRLFVESMYYLYDIEEVDYHHPGSMELANAVRQKADKTNVILLRNHGVLVYDISIREALARLETLEIASRMATVSNQNSMTLSPLEDEIVQDFVYNAKYKSILPRGAMK